ncbi:phosphotransferase enzyme family protein [Dictyobacter arantiisoli]|uniref:Aminoglycoside phosphotransferase domain-containing protein n=1 Tax=Dictyobacter arantiisoli TaxID=2014874 RepID=A0A5A5TB02_9CHLR|nr:phosphotransferase [Dictyobacter arantiisoli]GCF08425.1 hypothetical protein KDI_19890 [Dictyobacter arantiisoli]
MNKEDVWRAWPLAGPCTLSPLTGGTNKSVWRIETADGQFFVLYIYSDLALRPRVRYEQAILEWLSTQDLPYQVAHYLPSQSGDYIVPLEGAGFATLAPFLPGSQSRQDTVACAMQAGQALAQLTRALANCPDIPLSVDRVAPTIFGDLTTRHPLATDPLAALVRSPVEPQHIRQLRTYLMGIMEGIAELYARLPLQLVHRDVDASNLLSDQQGVLAVLDFEFATCDIRALDLAVMLSWWPVDRMGTGREWEIIDAVGRAYQSLFPLQDSELLALPELFRLRDAASLVHRIGSYLAGTTSEAQIQVRVAHSLWRENWLLANQQQLCEHALRWHDRAYTTAN